MTQTPAAIRTVTPGNSGQSRAARRLSKPGRPRFPMFRVVWHQHGVALALVLMLFAIAAAALAYSEPRLRKIAGGVGPGYWNASLLQSSYGPRYPDLAIQAIPLLIALFVGVRLASREMENGTAAFAWTQGYSKTRWLLGKLAAAAAVLVPAAIALGLVFGWWYRVYVPAIGYFSMHAFALYAPALAGWTLAGLTLGMAAGAVTRREGRGIWLTIVGWILLHRTVTLGSPRTPAGVFWPLQLAQLAILVTASALFTGVTIWLVRGTPAVPGMPQLLRSVPWPRQQAPERLARKLAVGRPRLAIARAAWRQHRTGLLVALGVLGGFAIILLVTGLHIHAEPARLRPRFASFTGVYEPGAPTNGNLFPPLLLPFLIGAFLGATLTAQEFERRTATFAWAQGITRARWMTGKLIAVGLVLAPAAIAVGIVFQWWDQPYIAARIADPAFALYAPVFAGWMLVNFTTAAFLGAVTRSRSAAAVICLLCTLFTAGWNAVYLRPRYFPPAIAVNGPAPAGSVFLNWYVGTPDGRPLTGAAARRAWRALDNTSGWTNVERALGRFHAASIQAYQPVSRFWPFQTIETAGLLTIALLFGAATVWIVRRSDA
jgi:ABC-type transport system involved in multi-copper enzyme maturation permease subunit